MTLVARGPKPVAALREWDSRRPSWRPSPTPGANCSPATEGRPERRIAVQEYGRSNPELMDGLRARGAEVTPVRVYQ